MKVLGVIEVVSVRKEPLNAITQEDMAREGFQFLTPEWFVDFLCESNRKINPETPINRIEFKKVQP